MAEMDDGVVDGYIYVLSVLWRHIAYLSDGVIMHRWDFWLQGRALSRSPNKLFVLSLCFGKFCM